MVGEAGEGGEDLKECGVDSELWEEHYIDLDLEGLIVTL